MMRVTLPTGPSRSSVVAQSPTTESLADPTEAESPFIIWAQLLIPGRGQPISNGAVVVNDDKIEWVGSFLNRPSRYRNLTPTFVNILMPGLWDCHVHFTGIDTAALAGVSNMLLNYGALAGAITVDDLRRTLMAGYTTVRELCGYAGDLWPGVKNGLLVGPNIYSSIAALSITGGHGDIHTEPLPAVLQAMDCGAPLGICDGVDDCVKTVRKMIRRGARVIKVCTSGGVLSLNDDPEDRQFSDSEIKAMVNEAARSRRAVAAHAIGKAGIMSALRCGVKSIEHGMYLDEEVADAMIAKDAILVPTQHVARVISRDHMDELPEPIQRKVRGLVEQSKVSYRIAIKKGVKIALGTDMNSSDRASALSHGNNAYELVYAVELGMTPLQAIECATANGPETLGGMAPKSGQLKEGYDADIIAVGVNPLDDISVLTKPSNITHVWKGGKVYKSPPLLGS